MFINIGKNIAQKIFITYLSIFHKIIQRRQMKNLIREKRRDFVCLYLKL